VLGLLQNHAASCHSKPSLSPYLAVPHVRDALIPLADRWTDYLWTVKKMSFIFMYCTFALSRCYCLRAGMKGGRSLSPVIQWWGRVKFRGAVAIYRLAPMKL